MPRPSLRVDHSRASTQGDVPVEQSIPRKDLLQKALRGCDWITDVAQVMEPDSPDYGVLRGEYDTKDRKWTLYGPFWHTGQAVRLLLQAYQMTGEDKYLQHAMLGGRYMIRDQAMDRRDEKFYGFVHGRESEGSNTASQLEGLGALYDLYLVTGDGEWLERFRLAMDWIARNLYIPGEGLFYNGYVAVRDELAPLEKSRPTNDDALFWVAYQVFKEPSYLQIFREVADRLLRDEDPPGNWLKYRPCNPDAFDGLGSIHARHAWWWGYPMLHAYEAFKEEKYLEAAIRAGDWYLENSNVDGGYYYHVSPRGRYHLSFDFSTSAVGCAVIMWCELWKRLKQDRYRTAIARALGFLQKAQFNQDVLDPNIGGAFFEGFLPPDGTMEPGFYIRDIATIFSARAMLTILEMDTAEGIACTEY